MRSTLIFVGVALLSGAAAAELKVTVYEGPTECDDANKAKKGDFLKVSRLSLDCALLASHLREHTLTHRRLLTRQDALHGHH